MGFRFRKSLKIAPGLKLNIGKRGISSVSALGFNYGLANTHSKAQSTKIQPQKSVSKTSSVEVKLTIDDDGTVHYLDSKGKPLPEGIIKEVKKQNGDLILSALAQQCEKFNLERESLLQIHLNTPPPVGQVVVNRKPLLPKQKTQGIVTSIFPGQKQKADEQNKTSQLEYERDLKKWEEAEFNLRNDMEVMNTILSNALASIAWPRETNVSFDIVDGGKTLLLDVDLPEIEDMPVQETQVNPRDFRLCIKNLQLTQIQKDYLTHIHGIGFHLLGVVFAYLPAISLIVISGYSQRINKKTGYLDDEYLYSARVTRRTWDKINFYNLQTLDVVACFNLFELRRNVTQRGIISPIEPFGQ